MTFASALRSPQPCPPNWKTCSSERTFAFRRARKYRTAPGVNLSPHAIARNVLGVSAATGSVAVSRAAPSFVARYAG